MPRFVVAACIVSFAMLALFAVTFEFATHHYMNASPSMPLGGYWLPLRAQTTPQVGQIALACLEGDQLAYARRLSRDLDPSNACYGAPSIIKVIAATAGARVRVDAHGVWINGALLANSAPLHGLALAPEQTVPPGKAWLWSPVTIALDSRYLGPLAIASIVYPDRSLTAVERERLIPSFVRDRARSAPVFGTGTTHIATYRRLPADCSPHCGPAVRGTEGSLPRRGPADRMARDI